MNIIRTISRAISVVVIIVVGYATMNMIIHKRIIIPFVHTSGDEIYKKAVTENELKDKSHIICKWSRVTGFDFLLIKDETGKHAQKHVKVSGIDAQNELSYEFLTSGNSFVFYITDKKEYFSDDFGDCTEYSAEGWDVLYPVRRASLITLAPKYILKSDIQCKP